VGSLSDRPVFNVKILAIEFAPSSTSAEVLLLTRDTSFNDWLSVSLLIIVGAFSETIDEATLFKLGEVLDEVDDEVERSD
jgi:hypothetical protein